MDTVDPLRIIFAFGLTLGLIALCAYVLRYMASRNPQWLMAKGSGRLQVVETKMIDARRKLVLIKRDEQEHLLLISPQGETVVETIKDQNA